MINNYEIGGNEVKPDVSEAIADIPGNRSLVISKLTSDEPISPEAVTGLTDINQVFAHYQPQIDAEFSNSEGQPVKETFHFSNVGDFEVKKLTEQSKFLKGVKTKKDFYDFMIRQLRSNKVLQRALENPESKSAFVEALQGVLAELEESDTK